MIKTDKLILCVAPFGSFMGKDMNPNIPLTPDEIAEDVYRSWNAGASIVHLHARDKNGIATTDPELAELITQDWGTQRVYNLYASWRKQMVEVLQKFGMRSIRELVGRTDLLRHLDYN